MAAFNANGGVVVVGDRVTVRGKVQSYTGSGQTAAVVVETPWAATTFTASAYDMNAAFYSADASDTAISANGAHFGVAGQSVSVRGVVTAISGSGNTAILTVTLICSGLSVLVPSGACNSDGV
jgi:DNA/RNA endonuclease YhcR with UshA esterase domain